MEFLKNLFKNKEEVKRGKNVDDLFETYSEIANTMNEIVPIEWDEIYFYSELTYDDGGYSSVSVCFYYRDRNGVVQDGLNIDNEYPGLKKQFDIAMERLMAHSLSVGEHLRRSSPKEEEYIMFTLILTEDFKVTSKIEYEIENMDEHKRRLIWKETYLK